MNDFPNVNDLSQRNRLIGLIDNTISTTLPDEESDPELFELVNKYQIHKHSKAYCLRKSSRRFGFPFYLIVVHFT